MISYETEPTIDLGKFSHEEAFSRSVGWFTPDELASLREKRVAIPGMGGVGGHHLMNLVRMGVGKFRIADMDVFEVGNFNRQAGASMNSVNRAKTDVMKEMALAINPEAEIEVFPDGVHETNIDTFLDGVDLVADGLDVFVIDIRVKLFEEAHRRGIPVITAAPLGMGTSILAFNPKGMSFNEYFRLDLAGMTESEKMLQFIVGISPKFLQRSYLVYPEIMDLKEKRVPSLPMGCVLASGTLVSFGAKILLGRGPNLWAPRGLHYDAYRNKAVRFYRPGGNGHPLNRLILSILKRQYLKDPSV
ncbi:MAG: ThiF family adenylyltransferase [Candidatus Kapaibacterium sp.]